MRAIARRRDEGGVWCPELTLAQLAHWLLSAGPRPETPDEDVEVAPYLVELSAADGPVSLVRPPGTAPWRTGPPLPGTHAPVWLPR
jgi:hypothetical protein